MGLYKGNFVFVLILSSKKHALRYTGFQKFIDLVVNLSIVHPKQCGAFYVLMYLEFLARGKRQRHLT